MASADRRLTYGTFTEVNGRPPTLEDIEDGFVMCSCGRTLKPEEFEYYQFQCEPCEKRTDQPHEPEFEKNFETDGVRRIDTANAKHKADSRQAPLSNVTEIPRGEYDAVRTLRHLLAMAEKGEIVRCLVVVAEPIKGDDGAEAMWASWSDMTRESVLWMTRWLQQCITRRYFGGPEEDD